MNAELSGKKQRGKPFQPGQSGNPAGRPPGSLSIIGRLKQKWAEDPDDFERFVQEIRDDKNLRREILQQVDGKPIQPIGNADGEPFVIQITKYGDSQSAV